MRYQLFTVVLFLFVLKASAQNIYIHNAKKNLKIQYSKALKLYQINEFESSKKAFKKILAKNPKFVDPYILLGSIGFDQKNFDEAETWFQKALDLDSFYQIKVYYTLALCQFENYQFTRAKLNLEKFLELEKSNKDLIQKAVHVLPTYRFADSVYRITLDIKLEAIASINTEQSEYLPSITADGRTMLFTRRIGIKNEDLYLTNLDENGNWSEPKALTEINSPYNEGAPTISPDGNAILFTSCNRPESFGGCDLFISHFKKGNWTRPVNLGDKINTPAYESQPCLAHNGKWLIFTSNRKGTFGGMDLWQTSFTDEKGWSIPKNLGPVINTVGHESCPFLHPNGITLFFSSTGHTGMGNNDIFYSNLDSKGNWTKPVNLGFPINTPLDESSFITDFTGTLGFMATDRLANERPGSKNQLDLYTFQMPPHLRPMPAEYLSIQVYDAASNQKMEASVTIFELENSKTYYKNTSRTDASLLVTVPIKQKYAIHIEKEAYQPYFEHINTSEIPGSFLNPRILNIYLNQVKQLTKPVVLKNVFFEFSSAELKPESHYELNQLKNWLLANPGLKIKITGHTDNEGEDEYNFRLSFARAGAVKKYLLSMGIAEEKIAVEGMGSTKPVRSNDTAEGRAQNRRTEFEIIHN
ncbi:MAG: PD40 domain-containing protein [Saprospiraceae bacterium]|nr:PD40 domain-containing protein [Saprospiraceae bacterium]